MREIKIYDFLKGTVKIDLIKKYMKQNHFSHAEFAKKCGISRSALYSILTDGANFYMDNLYKIAKVMNVHPVELFN